MRMVTASGEIWDSVGSGLAVSVAGVREAVFETATVFVLVAPVGDISQAPLRSTIIKITIRKISFIVKVLLHIEYRQPY